MDTPWLISLVSFSLTMILLIWWGYTWWRRCLCDMRGWMIWLFILQTAGLVYEAVEVGACPISGTRGSAIFVAWSINLFYLTLGRSYRLSILGLFTLPVLSLLQGWALLNADEVGVSIGSVWSHFHRGVMMIGSSAMVISAVAGVVFLVQNALLKRQLLVGLNRALPPIQGLEVCMRHLMPVTFIILVFGCFCGMMVGMPLSILKSIFAGVLMIGYVMMLWRTFRVGMPGKFLAYWSVGVLVISVIIFRIS